MKRVFCVLCLVVIMLAGSINVFSAPYPEPGNDSAAETVIVLSDIFEEQ